MEVDLGETTQPLNQPEPQDESPLSRQRQSSTDTERPPQSAQQGPTNEEAPSAEDVEIEDDDPDPAESIKDFDWNDLFNRYHDAIGACEGDQAALMQEWEELMNFFRSWAQAGHYKETDRTFLRLKTRVAYVQNSEEHLEKTRLHYVSVVQAFESALRLLTGVSAG